MKFVVGTRIDGLVVMMLLVVTIISLLVHIYSTAYMRDDRRFTYYYAALSLFSASMLLLVVSANLLQLLVGWELVGVCSFMLIGHWWEEKPNSDAALKAFLTTRTGDVGLMIGVIVCFFAAGTFDIAAINEYALSPHAEPRPDARGVGRARCSGSWARAASSSCTPGSPTPWPVPRRCRR